MQLLTGMKTAASVGMISSKGRPASAGSVAKTTMRCRKMFFAGVLPRGAQNRETLFSDASPNMR